MKTTHKLYNNSVTVDFDSEARQNRYIVTDEVAKLDKKPVPGVTSVIDKALSKPGLMTFPLNAALGHLGATFDENTHKWVLKQEITLTSELVNAAAKAWTVRADAGKDVGTIVHEAIEKFLRSKMAGEKYIESNIPANEAGKAYIAFMDWYHAGNTIKPLAIEQIVYSRANQFAGTFDCLLEIDGKTVLADLKTTNVSRYGLKVGGNWTGIYPEAFLQLGAYSLAYTEEKENHVVPTPEKEFEKWAKDNEPGAVFETHKTVPYEKIDDLMVINITKTGQCHTLRASELGLSVEDCEQNFIKARDLVTFVSTMKGK